MNEKNHNDPEDAKCMFTGKDSEDLDQVLGPVQVEVIHVQDFHDDSVLHTLAQV